MPAILTATLALTTVAAVRSNARSKTATSVEGQFASAQVTQLYDRLDETISLQSAHSDLIAELDNLAAEHSLPGWDGIEAPPVSYTTIAHARLFIDALPAGVPKPELAVDPDNAAISFEWHGGYRRVFSVSIGDSGRLACAGLDGVDQWYAALGFDGELPALVSDSIRRVTV
jgi:hypothetical protein